MRRGRALPQRRHWHRHLPQRVVTPIIDKRLALSSTVTFIVRSLVRQLLFESAVLYGFFQHVLFGTYISSGTKGKQTVPDGHGKLALGTIGQGRSPCRALIASTQTRLLITILCILQACLLLSLSIKTNLAFAKRQGECALRALCHPTTYDTIQFESEGTIRNPRPRMSKRRRKIKEFV